MSANALHAPSYLSGPWALSFYGVIPESVPVYTSVTTRTPREYENPFGVFSYRNVKRKDQALAALLERSNLEAVLTAD